jgi:hypothetical protein
VTLKKRYSRRADERSGEVSHKWKIDPQALADKPDSDWELKLLELSPDRLPGETGKDIALRLHRETLLARTFLRSLHDYVCQDGPARQMVKDIMTEVNLGEFSALATPKGLIKVGAGSLFAKLTVVMPLIPSAGIALATIVICVVGLDALCRNYGKP